MSAKCPKDSDLVRLSMRETLHDESERLFRHLADCTRCSARFAVLRQVKRDLRPAVESFAREFSADRAGPLLSSAARGKLQEPGRPAPPPTPPPPPRSRLTFLGLALNVRFAAGFLALLAVVAVGIYMTASRGAMYSNLRSPADALTLVEPAGRIPDPPRTFRWSPVPNAESYLFEIVDESLERVHFTATFLINELVLPAEVEARLVRGRTYVWTVSAQDAESELLAARSASFVIE